MLRLYITKFSSQNSSHPNSTFVLDKLKSLSHFYHLDMEIAGTFLYFVWLLGIYIFYWTRFIASLFLDANFYFTKNVTNYWTYLKLLKAHTKIPEHVVLAFQYKDLNENVSSETLDLLSVSRVTAWVLAAGVKRITLYDKQGKYLVTLIKYYGVNFIIILLLDLGVLKNDYNHLEKTIANELVNFTTGKKYKIMFHLEDKWANCTGAFGDVHVFLRSHSDGKQALLKSAADNYDRELLHGRTVKESQVDGFLDTSCCKQAKNVTVKNEPDLMIVFGEIKTLEDCLPWHIRLTEIQ